MAHADKFAKQLSFLKDIKKLLQQKLGGIKAIRVLREAVLLD